MPTIRETSPAQTFAAVTPHDSTNLTTIARALYVGTGGDVVIVGLDNVAVTFKNVPSGTLLPCVARRVNATGTGAQDIVALY